MIKDNRITVANFLLGIAVLIILGVAIWYSLAFIYLVVSSAVELISNPRTSFDTCKVILLTVITYQLKSINRSLKNAARQNQTYGSYL